MTRTLSVYTVARVTEDWSTAPVPDWRASAACLDEDPDLFFPIGYTGPAIAQTANAKAVCRTCPVIADCLEWALDTRQDFGIVGGLSEGERRSLKRHEYRARAKREGHRS